MTPIELTQLKVLQLEAPVADGYAGTKTFGPVNTAYYDGVMFLLSMGVNTGGAGRTKIYAYGYDVAAGTHKVAVAYWCRGGTGSAPDTEGAWTKYAAGAEFTPLAANSVACAQLVFVPLDEAYITLRATGYSMTGVGLICIEAADDPIVGSVTALMTPRFNKGAQLDGILA